MNNINNGFKKLEKNALGCIYTTTIIACAIAIIIVTVASVYLGLLEDRLLLVIFVAIVGIIVLNMLISPYFRYNRYRYKLDVDALEIIEGYIFVSHKIVPIERIQNIELKQGPIDRLFRVSKMNITTGGSDITVRFVSKVVADEMSDKLKKKINLIVKEDEAIAQGEK